MSPEMLGPAMISVSQAIGQFNTFLPNFSDIRKADPSDKEFVADVRMGEIAAAAITIGVGAIVSSFTQSPVPITVATLMVLFLIMLYESTLRAYRPLESKKDA